MLGNDHIYGDQTSLVQAGLNDLLVRQCEDDRPGIVITIYFVSIFHR